MKRGTAYAQRVQRFYAQVKKRGGPVGVDHTEDPLSCLFLAVLGDETSLSNANRALDKLTTSTVDANEIRVSSPREVAEAIGPHVPNQHACATRLCTVLNSVFSRTNTVNLDLLRSMGKRDAKRWLEELGGVEPYHVASVMLWSLGGHAVPVNSRLLAALRREELVDPGATVAEVQSFLDRHITPAEAKVFCLTMTEFAMRRSAGSSKTTTPVRKKTASKAASKTAKTPAKRAGKTSQRQSKKKASTASPKARTQRKATRKG
ncbi:MAG: hypothetical protein GY842_04560 [bacterium]|nr:hypothetical protein [bacterium]